MAWVLVPTCHSLAIPVSPETTTQHVTVPLDTAMEMNLWARREPPIATLTWFQIPQDSTNHKKDAIIEALRNKTRLVLRHNPWLMTGRIEGGDPFSLLLQQQPPKLEYKIPTKNDDGEGVNFEQVFRHVKIEGYDNKNILSPTMPLSGYYAATLPYTTINEAAGPLCRLTVLESTTTDADSSNNNLLLAVIFALSHAVADMSAYYALLDMILSSSDDPPLPLRMNSIDGADQKARQALGATAFDLTHHVLANLVKGARGLAVRFASGQRGKAQWYTVDPAVMAAEKETYLRSSSPMGNFLSTNDVLTSYFFRHVGADLGLLCVGYRHTVLATVNNRLTPNCTEMSLGRNRWGTIVYHQTPQQRVGPGTIRKSVALLQEGSSLAHDALPSPWAFATGHHSIAVASSWVQKNPNLSLGDSKFTGHVPLYDFATYAPSGFCVMRTFTYDKKTTGMYIAGDAQMVEQFVSSTPRFLIPV